MSTINISVADDDVLQAINSMLDKSVDLSPAMLEITAIMESAAEGAFIDEADPATGKAWEKLSDKTTIPWRAESNHWPGKILQVSGGLAGSIETDHGKDFALIGSGKVQAAMLFFGGKTSARSMIPGVEIPGRRFIGLSASEQQDAVNIIRDFLAE